MSDGPGVALAKAIYNELYGSADLVAELGNYCIYNTNASQFHEDDYIVFSVDVDDDHNATTQGARIRDAICVLKAISYDMQKSVKLSDIMDELMHMQELSISGWEVLWQAREGSVKYEEIDPGSRHIYHRGFQLHLIISKADNP